MVAYLYRAENGAEVEVDARPGKAPKSVRRGGVTYLRVYTIARPVVDQTGMHRSITLADNSPYAKHRDSKGRPYFTNKTDKADTIKRAADHGETWVDSRDLSE
jgi:hypothetical protein